MRSLLLASSTVGLFDEQEFTRIFFMVVVCCVRIAKKQIFTENGSVTLGRKIETLADRIGHYESIDTHPEPAPGHQILCARYIGPSDLASSLDGLARRELEVPLHAGLGSRRLRQDDASLSLGPIAGSSPSSSGLGVPR